MEKLFKLTAHLEGWSYLILLLVAMPLKYIGNNPLLIRPVGMAHGALFVAYVILVFIVAKELKWGKKFTAWALLASFIPLATFIISKQMHSEKSGN